jgi:branched-chain amino acid aminotransferase
VEKVDWIWMNGEFVRWDDARVHVLSHGLHYGTGVFEGIRAYDTERGSAIFRHRDHLDRLAKSATMYYLDLPYQLDALRDATHELIRRNGLRSCYIRPLAFRGYGEMGLYAQSAPIDVMVAVWPWGAYLGEEAKRTGVRAKVSSWRRISPDSLIPHAKASGQYLNSVLAKTETAKAGYDEAILLDARGFVCEGSGENVFIVRDGTILTPPHTASILDGISRRSVIQIARDLGYTVAERDIARAELYLAEEAFCCGTAADDVVEPAQEPVEQPSKVSP